MPSKKYKTQAGGNSKAADLATLAIRLTEQQAIADTRDKTVNVVVDGAVIGKVVLEEAPREVGSAPVSY